MVKPVAEFKPDWVSPPGDTILDLLEEKGWTQKELAVRLGYTDKHLSQLINGKVSLSMDAAARLERVLGGSIEFWMNREANYQRHKARIEAEQNYSAWAGWLDELPVLDLMKIDAIPKQRNVVSNKPKIVESCLRFFGIASPNEWRQCYGSMNFSFRRSQIKEPDVGAISAWLRLGEQKAETAEVPKYNQRQFEKALDEIRGMTLLPPQSFFPKMHELLNAAGVVLALVPAIPRAKVSGVARWLSPTKPLIQLSLFGKTNDKFWFTFFHEVAHLLLHAGGGEAKKSIFLDDPNAGHSADEQEHEANHWASRKLIPEAYENELATLKTKDSVINFAKRLSLHPGIVVGRLQHEGIVDFKQLNDLKARYEWQ